MAPDAPVGPTGPNAPAAPVGLSEERSKALQHVLAVQREILLLPADAPWLAGRFRGVCAALSGCLRATGAIDQLPALEGPPTAEVFDPGRAQLPLPGDDPGQGDLPLEAIAGTEAAAAAIPPISDAAAPAATDPAPAPAGGDDPTDSPPAAHA